MGRDAGAESASLGKRRCGRARRGEAPRLIDAAQLFREALRPAAGERGIVVDEDIGAVIDRRAIADRLDQGEGLAVLITRGVGELVIASR
jgi:hypothetical protein